MEQHVSSPPRTEETRVALVTGGASGIGRAISRSLSNEGVRVVIADTDLEGARAVAQECSVGARAIRCDVTKQADITRAVAETVSWGGSLDILVNNAGIVRRTDVATTTADGWWEVMDINLSAVFFMSQAAIPALRSSKSEERRIINIASCASDVGFAYPAYTASKGGVVALTRQLASEVSAQRITVNCVNPGFIRTPINDAAFAEEGNIRAVTSNIPLGRMGKPEDVAATVTFLASAGAGFINAEVLHVDGGMLGVMPSSTISEGLGNFDD